MANGLYMANVDRELQLDSDCDRVNSYYTDFPTLASKYTCPSQCTISITLNYLPRLYTYTGM